jgi:MOSC domain-containing protein YiiM
MSAQLVSVNVATAQPLDYGSRTVFSGIFKAAVAGPVKLARLGLAGDEQADHRYHGGPDKAVNVYPSEHYAHWTGILGKPCLPGAFGENFTTTGLLEDEVAIGDVFRVGSALVQVTQPRQPCRKLAAKHRQPQLVLWVEESGRTGFYLRSIEAGEVQAGDRFERVERPAELVTISEANRILRHHKHDRKMLKRLHKVEALSKAWRDDLERLLGDG